VPNIAITTKLFPLKTGWPQRGRFCAPGDS